MSTADEIISYCKELYPVGALMVTGEWGTGKTYLIEHNVKETLLSTHIIVRISLFGISNIEELRRIVKRRWIEECSPFFKNVDNEEFVAVGKSLLSAIGKISAKAAGVSDAALSINPEDFITISSKVGKKNHKRVCLVFDDLERSNLNTVEILGCINEYCENDKFLVVIIANEEKIVNNYTKNKSQQSIIGSGYDDQDNQVKERGNNQNLVACLCCSKSNELSYEEIKEKIVCRTVTYNPDYSQIIKTIVEEKNNGFSPEYRGLLRKNNKSIINIFEYEVEPENAELEEAGRLGALYNIRSLKCAFHDFERVYMVLKDEKCTNDIDEHLIAFIAYMLAARANLIYKSDRYGYLIANSRFNTIYPFVDIKTLYTTEINWIIDGVWDEKRLRSEIAERKILIKKIKKSKEPKEILKINNIFDIDDNILSQGFVPLLNECYNGKLTFNEYIQFICNARNMRVCNFPQYKEIHWKEVLDGVNFRITDIRTKSGSEVDEQGKLYRWIEEGYRKNYSEEELNVYDTIIKFVDDGELYFEQNRKEYIDTVLDGKIKMFTISDIKRFDCFDTEMANVTIKGYDKLQQEDKNIFPGYFTGLFGRLDREKLFQKEKTIKGLELLELKLKQLSMQYEAEAKNIAYHNLKYFLKEVSRLKEKYCNSTRSPEL